MKRSMRYFVAAVQDFYNECITKLMDMGKGCTHPEECYVPLYLYPELFRKAAEYNHIEWDEETFLKEMDYNKNQKYYCTNSLLKKIAESLKDNRRSGYKILDNMSELLDVYCDLYSAICKYTYLTEKGTVYTYRDDRYYTCIHMNLRGFNESFLSSTLNDKKTESPFQKKERLTFLEFQAQLGAEWLNMNEVLGEKSKYTEEREILFAPFQHVVLKSMNMTEKEKTILGNNNTSPHGKYLVLVKKSSVLPVALTENGREEMQRLVLQLKEQYIQEMENEENSIYRTNKRIVEYISVKSHSMINSKYIWQYWKQNVNDIFEIFISIELGKFYNPETILPDLNYIKEKIK